MTIDPWILTFSALTVIVTVWMGFWSAKKSKTASDFFVAGRSVSVGWNASAISGEYLSAASFMGVAGMVMSSGYDALWYPVCYACGYLFLLLFIAGPLRRFGAYTIPDFAEGRFDSPLFRKIAVVFVLFIGFFYTMPQMSGAGKTLSYIFQDLDFRGTPLTFLAPHDKGEALKGLHYGVGVFVVGALITLNVALGGMKGITLVQAFQYWAKMFAISVPVFVLMAVYGHYGKQVGLNGTESGQKVAAGKGFVFREVFEKWAPNDPRVPPIPGLPQQSASSNQPPKEQTPAPLVKWLEYAKSKYEQAKARLSTNPPGMMMFAQADAFSILSTYQMMTARTLIRPDAPLPSVKIDVSLPSVTQEQMISTMEAMLKTNGVILLHVDEALTVVAPAELSQELEGYLALFGPQTMLREPLPAKAPRDETWLNPFGPLTTKAVAAANAGPRWNVSSENRAKLVDFRGQPAPRGMESFLDSAEDFVERLGSRKAGKPGVSQFADWTNMPPNTSRSLGGGGFPLLSTLREFGLLLERPVLVATNLPRQKVAIGGSFHSRDEFLKYLEFVLLTNGVRLDVGSEAVRAVAVADWEQYRKKPAGISFVPNRLYGMRLGPHEAKLPDGRVVQEHVEPRILVHEYGDLLGKQPLMSANLPTNGIDFNPTFEVMLAHEAKAAMESTLKLSEVTVFPAGSKEIWAVPTAELDQFQHRPIDPRPFSLLYTYSLIIALVCGTAGLPHILVRFYTNPDGVAAKRTTMWVMILIGVFYLFPPVFGVIGRNLMPELYNGLTGVKGTDGVVLRLPTILDSQKFGVLGSVLSGITCAGAFAAFMSTFSGLLVSMTGAMAHDVYGRILRPGSTAEQRLLAFKIAAVGLGAGAILLGFFVEKFEINKMVGWAFAIAATSYFPLLFLSTWWRGITMKGAATGMLVGGTLSLLAIASTMFADQAAWFAGLKDYYAAHPLVRILAEQPAIWALPLAMGLMFTISKLTAKDVPADIRMKMLVLHAPEKLGLKQEYIQEHQQGH